MKILLPLSILVSNLFFGQYHVPHFNITKFINDGGISKEIYTQQNGQLKLNEKYSFDKYSNTIKVTLYQDMNNGSSLIGLDYILDNENRISEEKNHFKDNQLNEKFTQIIKYRYTKSSKQLSYYDSNNKVYLKTFFFYNDKDEVVESITLSNDDLILHERTINYKLDKYEISETEKFTFPKYKTVTKRELDKNGFSIYTESKIDIYSAPKQYMSDVVLYFENEIDQKGNLSKKYAIYGQKKELIQEVITQYLSQ